MNQSFLSPLFPPFPKEKGGLSSRNGMIRAQSACIIPFLVLLPPPLPKDGRSGDLNRCIDGSIHDFSQLSR